MIIFMYPNREVLQYVIFYKYTKRTPADVAFVNNQSDQNLKDLWDQIHHRRVNEANGIK